MVPDNPQTYQNLEQAILAVSQAIALQGVAISQNRYKFRAYRNNTAQTLGAGVFTKIGLNTVDYDTAAAFNTTTNRYVAPVSGYYHLDGWVLWDTTSTSIGIPSIYKNGVEIVRGTDIRAATANRRIGANDTIFLAANDYVELFAYSNVAAGLDTTQAPAQNHFSGFLVTQV